MDQVIGSVPSVANQQSLTERLAGYWSGARYEDSPQPVVAMAKSVLLDTLSVGVRGAESEAAVATRKGIANALECSSGSASIWGTHSSLPPSVAALVNGTAAHAYLLDALVDQALHILLLVASQVTSKAPITHPQQPCRLHLGQLPRMPTFIRLFEFHLPNLL